MAFVWNIVNPHRAKGVFPLNNSYGLPTDDYLSIPEVDDEYYEDTEDFSCIIYTVILPLICTSGILGNILSFFVLIRIKIKCSSYTYLTVKTASDLAVCFLLLMSVLAHGVFYNMDGEDFDLLITLPAASIFSSISVIATVGVTLDRLLVMRNPTCTTKPAMCSPPVARRIMAGGIFISIITNLPYFFIFALRDDGFLHPTKFFNSRVYYLYNWIRFIIFGIGPSAFLTVGTVLLIISIKRVSNQLKQLSCKSRATCNMDPTRMTITLIAIAIFFLAGEVPGHIVSKKAAFVFLYNGDASTVITDDDDLETLRLVSLILGAVNCSINFFVFYMLHPPFGKGLKKLFCRKKKQPDPQQVLVNVFVISQGQVDVNDVKKFKRLIPKLYNNYGNVVLPLSC